MYSHYSKIFEENSVSDSHFFRRQGVYDLHGRRKYVTDLERTAALMVARSRLPTTYTLFATLAYSGCRLSEALEIDRSRVDLEQQALVFRTLKKRGTHIYRVVPVPHQLMIDIDHVHRISPDQVSGGAAGQRLWTWSRTHAWRLIKDILSEADVKGVAASPRGLRHGFGVTAVTKGVPLHLVQRWLGHTQLATTAIYANALGDEERQINARMWGR